MNSARELTRNVTKNYVYSICTIVNCIEEYSRMIESFVKGGFTRSDCEYLFVDNCRGNTYDAFEACNIFLREAQGKYIILCHQDIELLDNRAQLDRVIGELDSVYQNWGACGNAGATSDGQLAIRISDPSGENICRGGPFPKEVVSLDENFMVVKSSANLALSGDLSGFHWYGLDLCILADVLGYRAFVVDFHLRHKSAGKKNIVFRMGRFDIYNKYRRAFRPRQRHTVTLSKIPLSPGIIQSILISGERYATPVLYKIKKFVRKAAASHHFRRGPLS